MPWLPERNFNWCQTFELVKLWDKIRTYNNNNRREGTSLPYDLVEEFNPTKEVGPAEVFLPLTKLAKYLNTFDGTGPWLLEDLRCDVKEALRRIHVPAKTHKLEFTLSGTNKNIVADCVAEVTKYMQKMVLQRMLEAMPNYLVDVSHKYVLLSNQYTLEIVDTKIPVTDELIEFLMQKNLHVTRIPAVILAMQNISPTDDSATPVSADSGSENDHCEDRGAFKSVSESCILTFTVTGPTRIINECFRDGRAFAKMQSEKGITIACN